MKRRRLYNGIAVLRYERGMSRKELAAKIGFRLSVILAVVTFARVIAYAAAVHHGVDVAPRARSK